MEASSSRIRELVREREVMKRAVVRRYGGGGGGEGTVGGAGEDTMMLSDDDDGGEDETELEPAVPGEAPGQAIRGLPRIDDAPTLKGSSLLWKRLGIALEAGFEEAAKEGAAATAASAARRRDSSSTPSLSLIADALAASSTDQPEEHVSNLLSPRSRPRRRWEGAAYWSSSGSADADSDEMLSFRLAHPLCVATAVTVRPFEAHFQPGNPIYAPREVQLASGRSDLWGEELVSEWERGRRERDEGTGTRRRREGLLRRWGFGRANKQEGGGEEQREEETSPSSSQSLERFVAADERGLSEARTQLVVEERRRAHPPAYPRFDGRFLQDTVSFVGDGNGGSGGVEAPAEGGTHSWAAMSRRLPVLKSGRAQRLSLMDEGRREEGSEGGGGGASTPPSLHSSARRRWQRRRQSGGGAGGAAAAAEALLMTGGHALLLLRGRTQTQEQVDDLFYTCLSYVKVEGFAVRGLRVGFRPRPSAAAAAARVCREGGEGGAAAAAAAPLVPVLTAIPEGRDPLFDVIPGGLLSVSERGRAATRSARRRRALESAGRLFDLPADKLSSRSREGTRALAEALVAAADDSASDGEGAAIRELVGGGEEEEEEREREEGGGNRGGGGDRDRVGDVENGDETQTTTKAALLSGLLLPDGSAFPLDAAMRMVRMLAAAFARRE